MGIYRRCPNCHKLYEGRECIECKKKFARANSRKRLEENEARKIYNTYTWEKVRRHMRLKYMDYDIWLLAKGQVYKCEKPYIHHIVERDENPMLVFDEDNLITVSKESHEEIHREYEIDKPRALARIEKGKREFRRLFGDD